MTWQSRVVSLATTSNLRTKRKNDSMLSDAADDLVQELAAMEAAPTAGDILKRVINEDNLGEMGGSVAETAMRDVHEDVGKHAQRVSRPHKTRSKAPAAPVDHPESIVEEPHRAGIAPAPTTRSRHPSRTKCSCRSCLVWRLRLNRGSTLEARVFLRHGRQLLDILPFGQGLEGHIQAQVGSAASQSHDNLVNRSVAMPRGIGASFEVGMGVSRSQDWRSMDLGLGRPR